jgi:Asp/Glu/hydantoin racemase
VIGKVIRTKLHSATKRKEGIIASKVESIRIDNETKQARAKDVLLLSLNEATELKRMSDKRLKKATKKKNVVSLNCRAN